MSFDSPGCRPEYIASIRPSSIRGMCHHGQLIVEPPVEPCGCTSWRNGSLRHTCHTFCIKAGHTLRLIAYQRPQDRHSFLSVLAWHCFRVSSRAFQPVFLWSFWLLIFLTRLTSVALSPLFLSRACVLADSAVLHMSIHLSGIRSCSIFSRVVSSLISLNTCGFTRRVSTSPQSQGSHVLINSRRAIKKVIKRFAFLLATCLKPI